MSYSTSTPATAIARHRTAIGRRELSRPTRVALDLGVLREDRSFFDYGCGRGDDVDALCRKGIEATGWDPYHRSSAERRPSDVVNLGYVLNVIENATERVRVAQDAWRLARHVLVVAVRMRSEATLSEAVPHEDGLVTVRNTFQKLFDQNEAREWLEGAVGLRPVAVGPGLFFLFRDEEERQQFLRDHIRQRVAAPRVRLSDKLFAEHREILDQLTSFVEERGRIPEDDEISCAPDLRLAFGTIRQAFRVVRRVTGEEVWGTVVRQRRQELLIHLALENFGGRPSFGHLPRSLQRDIRALLSSYSRACEMADKLLFSVGNREVIQRATRASTIGKLTGNALYVHMRYIALLGPQLRVYEGCARNFLGIVPNATLVKLHREKAAVSYLVYPEFERRGHPSLAGAIVADLEGLKVRAHDYRDVTNPPILHRKEEFLAPTDPLRDKFHRLTVQEERHGLYEDPSRIGTEAGWAEVLLEKGLAIRGHRVCRVHAC